MTTHKICDMIAKDPVEVETLYRVGVWAVNVTAHDRPFAVTHIPTGGSIINCEREDDAIAVVDAFGACAPDWCADAPWGDPKAHPNYWLKHNNAGAHLVNDARAIVQVRKFVRRAS